MWVAANHTPFGIERGFLRDRQGGEVWLTLIKGTFDVRRDGTLRVADEQVPPARAPVWSGEPGQSSLVHDNDFVLGKKATDVVVLRGHGYAPGGRAVPSFDVALKIGQRTKALRAHGIRAWVRGAVASGVVPSPARPADVVPLGYENAFGGADPEAPCGRPALCWQNPVGGGFTHRPASLLDKAAPQLQRLDDRLHAGPHEEAPAGFGAIAPSWAPRAHLAGTHDEAWKARRAPLLPDDFDERFYQAAPADQQVPGYLQPGQAIQLLNLTPDGYMSVVVPQLSLRVRVIFTDGEERVSATLHTVLLDPDKRRVQLVWHSALPCHRREHRLTRAIVDWEGDRTCLSP